MISKYVHWNSRAVPARKEGESDEDFEARMEWFRKHDRRVPVAGFGKRNFGFGCNYVPGSGTIGVLKTRPREIWRAEDGLYRGTGEYVRAGEQKGSWSVPEEA
ncbi:MAG: hypothetical protein J6Y62_01505 [Clostridia bacterium]|nr:hypothetical protein [Clostridia bacterium]